MLNRFCRRTRTHYHPIRNKNGTFTRLERDWQSTPENSQDVYAWADQILSTVGPIAKSGKHWRTDAKRVQSAFVAAGAKNVWTDVGDDLCFYDYTVLIEGSEGVVLMIGIEVDNARAETDWRGTPRRQEWAWMKVLGRRYKEL